MAEIRGHAKHEDDQVISGAYANKFDQEQLARRPSSDDMEIAALDEDARMRRAEGFADRLAEDVTRQELGRDPDEQERAAAIARMSDALARHFRGAVRPQAPMDQPRRRRIVLPDDNGDDAHSRVPLILALITIATVLWAWLG
jgi:hypothetical protein